MRLLLGCTERTDHTGSVRSTAVTKRYGRRTVRSPAWMWRVSALSSHRTWLPTSPCHPRSTARRPRSASLLGSCNDALPKSVTSVAPKVAAVRFKRAVSSSVTFHDSLGRLTSPSHEARDHAANGTVPSVCRCITIAVIVNIEIGRPGVACTGREVSGRRCGSASSVVLHVAYLPAAHACVGRATRDTPLASRASKAMC